jgi:hypothetical protein
MKRTVLMVAVAALCVAGSAVAEDRGGLIGSGTRSDDSGQTMGSGNAAGQTVGSGGFTTSAQDSGQVLGSGGRADSGQGLGSGTAVEIRQFDGFSLLVVSSDKGTFVIPIVE